MREIDFGGVVEALPGLVWTTEADGRSDFVNRGWREYTGLGLDEAIDHGWQAGIHPDDLASFGQSWDLIKQSGIARDIDARLRRFDGQYRWFILRPFRRYRRGAGVGLHLMQTRAPPPTGACVACWT